MGRLLVSGSGPNGALAAAEGGAHIADVEYPASALGTPYPLNIRAVRQRPDEADFKDMPISTNIGEDQPVRSTACQAVGVAVAGAEYIEFGLAGFVLKSAVCLGRNLVRIVREWFPKCEVYSAVFPGEESAACLDPLTESAKLAEDIDCDGLLIDTFRKDIGKGLRDCYDFGQLERFVKALHAIGKEAWLAGSITVGELSGLWNTRADVVRVRRAACIASEGSGRLGPIEQPIVAELVNTIPTEHQ
ncbi:MAG: hypothetical protein JSU86_20060 [Phycisphaerales bacterium]|nr:MAG: hypothetical protein JSU86_20060 [Phycisphaerales bacterium]